MLSERQLEGLLSKFEARMQKVTNDYLTAMGEHLRDIGKLSETDVHRLTELKRVGVNARRIQQEIAKAADISVDDLDKVFRAVAESNSRFAAEWFAESYTPDVKGPAKLSTPIERILKAQLRITAQEFKNLSNTTVVTDRYRAAVDVAVQTVQSGITDYNSAIREALRQAASDGLRVQYASGLTRRLDTATRQNVLDGVREINNDILRQLGKEYGADGVEISAHALCAEDHLPYQGMQFSNKDFEELQNNLQRPFGMWNCKHTIFPIILGITQPANDPEELAAYRQYSLERIEVDGTEKTRYQWTQEQRRIETAVRYQKDVAVAAKASGDMPLRRSVQANINRLMDRYDMITEQAGLRAESGRMSVAGFRRVKAAEELKNTFSSLKNATQNGILVVTETRKNHGRAESREKPNAVIDVVGKKSGVSRYIYDESGNAIYRVDNHDHGHPKEHDFKNGEHYHIAIWDGDKFVKYTKADEIPQQLRKLCADILK